MEMLSQVTSIQFGILSDKDILDMSVCAINKSTLSVEEGSVYDPRLGSVQNEVKCDTCHENVWKCPGHFGHIDLNIPVILFYKQCVTMLKCFCFECHRLLSSKKELEINGISGHERTLDYLSKINTCIHCNTPHPDVKFNISDSIITAQHKYKNQKSTRELNPATIKQIFDGVSTEDVKLLRVDDTMFHPKNLVLTKFPVIPTVCRPRMVTPDNISDDDLSIILADIVKNNQIIENEHTNKEKYDKAVASIKFRTLTYCDNSKGKAVHNTNHKPMTGIKERISKKGGIVRKNLMGKRCDQTGRTVIGPDPTLKLDQVAVPPEMAENLTIPEYVNRLNIDRLTDLVNNGKACAICKKNGVKINVSNAIIKRGTSLHHGDIVTRAGKKLVVSDCKMELLPGDSIARRGEKISLTFPTKRRVALEIGDKVDRHLQDGDMVLLNRQPTLHRNSMQAMRVVIKPGKTLRMNLAIVSGFNADFDGDEANIFIPQTLEAQAELAHLSNAKNNILSLQANKPEMVIVQDSLLGAYKMTEEIQHISRELFMHCLMVTNTLKNYNYSDRLETIQSLRNEEGQYTTHGLFGFLFPDDFHINYPTLKISYGVVVEGYFDASTLKGTKESLIRILCMEYGKEVAASFIDNIQFMTNAWLVENAFSVGIEDCLAQNEEKTSEILGVINKYIMEAEQMTSTTDNKLIREARVNGSLNKAKDIGLRIAKETLKPDNNFKRTVTSGSKGSYFNIAQITGLLGQQNVTGHRPEPTLTNGRRTMIHYPKVIPDMKRKYESRGFVTSSFIGGMNPKECFFHAMTGREGMTSTAMGTATSGYIQRRTVKMNEDLKIAYDGTVRDANKNIYQQSFGNHGFDPSKVTMVNGEAHPVNIKRLANRLNGNSDDILPLHPDDIEYIVERCEYTSTIPERLHKHLMARQTAILKRELSSIKLDPSKLDEFSDFIVTKYHTARITPGECVGILGAQSIGERQTQTTLNTFHTAGKLQQSGVERFQELLNTTKNLKVKMCTLHFKKAYETAKELRDAIGPSLVHLKLKDLVIGDPTIIEGDSLKMVYTLSLKTLFKYRLKPFTIAEKIRDSYGDCKCSFTARSISVEIERVSEANDLLFLETIQPELDQTVVCGIDGIIDIHLDHDGKEWYVVTEGSNLKKLLAHPLVNPKTVYCNDIWEVHDCLGISAVRKMLLSDIKQNVVGVNECHIQSLMDRMTFKGKPTSITRYSMRTNEVGPLSKATFEESIDTIVGAAIKTETDKNTGVSASIISGNLPRVGTGYMGIKIDFNGLKDVVNETHTQKPAVPPTPPSDESYIPTVTYY